MLSKKAKERLTELADYMCKVSPKADNHFDMNSFFDHAEGSYVEEHPVKPGKAFGVKELTMCGTSACALGWAATMPKMQNLGLAIEVPKRAIDGHSFPQVTYKHRRCDPFAAAQKLFDIDESQATMLFGGHINFDTPADWAQFCRVFMAVDGNVYHSTLSGDNWR